MSRRGEIIALYRSALEAIKSSNGYHTDFSEVTYWQATPTQYERNHLDFRDTTEEYFKQNNLYKCQLNIEITATVFETNNDPAPILGTLALEDLIKAVRCLSANEAVVNLTRSHKYVETKGKTACQVELEIAVCYKF